MGGAGQKQFEEPCRLSSAVFWDPDGPSTAATLSFLAQCRTSKSFDALLQAFLTFLHPLGFEHAAMVDLFGAREDPAPTIRFSTFPVEWVADVLRHGRYENDPIWTAAVSSREVVVWSSAVEGLGRNASDPALYYRRAGLEDGVTVPVITPHASRILIGAAHRVRVDAHTEAMLTVASNVLVSRAFGEGAGMPDHALTEREREILLWTARGRSAREIGILLTVSEKTVARHLLNVRSKLRATNTVHAVAVAMSEKLIDY